MPSQSSPQDEWSLPRPIPETYWVLPGRLLVGAHPGSRSRAAAMDRLRRFLSAGFTCFIDLTEPQEMPAYEGLLPFETPGGRRVEYLRLPLVDHAVPSRREEMTQILRALDGALDAGHVVYLHCRAGVGRSALVAGCWLAGRKGSAQAALDELQVMWKQAGQSSAWPVVPETAEQEAFVRHWIMPIGQLAVAKTRAPAAGVPMLGDRMRGCLLGLALGDATGARLRQGETTPALWTQQTALTLCLAESLLEKGSADPRDQIERYLRWQRDGHRSANGAPGEATPDVAKALANYRWRGQPRAGSHDPRARTASSLPRVAAAVLFDARDPAAAVTLAGQTSRTTHQSPVVIDACRYYAAMLVTALQGGSPQQVLSHPCEPAAGLWAKKPLKREVAEFARQPLRRSTPAIARDTAGDVLLALANMRDAVVGDAEFDAVVRRAVAGGSDPSLDGALAGTLFGALYGAAALPAAPLAALPGLPQLEEFTARLIERSKD